MAKITIEVESDGKYCDNCRFCKYYDWLYSWWCTLYKPANSLMGYKLNHEGDYVRAIHRNKPLRCQQCIDSEFNICIEDSLEKD